MVLSSSPPVDGCFPVVWSGELSHCWKTLPPANIIHLRMYVYICIQINKIVTHISIIYISLSIFIELNFSLIIVHLYKHLYGLNIYIFIFSTIDHYWLLHGQFKSSQELRGRNLHFECREVSSGGDSEINKWLGEGHRALVWKHGESKEFIMKKGDLNVKTYMKSWI